MLGSNDVYATIPVKNQDEANKFYGDTLGLRVETDAPGGVLFKSGSSGIFVYESQFAGTNEGTAATWVVDDVESVVAELKDKGIHFEHYPDIPQVMLEGDVHIWGDMKAAWFKDPSGNILNLTTKVG